MTRDEPRVTTAVGALLLAIALTACRGDGDPLAGPGSTARASAAPTPVASEAEVQQTPAPAAETAVPDGTASSAARSARAFPPASRNVEHGGQIWAVYLALSRVDASGKAEEPEQLARAEQQARAVGYEDDIGNGDLGCDVGAREALRLDPDRDYRGVSIFFDTQAQAKQFVDAYEPPVVGTARVTAYCLD